MQVMITRENYEEYLMLEADGELDAAGQRALAEFFKAHPELEAERAMWHSVKLNPDQDLVFPDKNQLLKSAPKAERRIIPFIWTAAAAVILFMILIPLLWKNKEGKEQHLTQTQKPAPAAPVQPAPVKPAPEAPARQTEPVQVVQKSETPVQQVAQPKSEVLAAHCGQDVARLEMIADRQVPVPGQIVESPLPKRIDMNAAYVNVPVESAHRISRINVAPANQEAIRLLKDAMDERINQAKNVAKNLRETAFEIRVKKGAININF